MMGYNSGMQVHERWGSSFSKAVGLLSKMTTLSKKL
jgi:hypothetical protein